MKYVFTGETLEWKEHLLKRICTVHGDEVGGWIEKEENLSQLDSCWVGDEAKVFGDAKVTLMACI